MQVRKTNGDCESATQLTHLPWDCSKSKILCEFVSGRVPTYWRLMSQMHGQVPDYSRIVLPSPFLKKNMVTIYFGISFTGSYELGGDLTIGSISWRQQINR
jgi:hypothetical protein